MKFYRLGIVLFVLISLGGCYPDSEISPDESDTVKTSYLKGTDFSQLKYYQMPDSVLRVDDSGNYVSRRGQYDELILQRVDDQLQARGFQKLIASDTMQADFYMIVSDLSYVSLSYYWNYIPYWYYYPDYYFPTDEDGNYYNAYFAENPPTAISCFPQSNVMIDMVEARFAPSQGNVPIYWRGLATGIAGAYMSDRMTRNIDQMFFQSPYLKTR